MVDNLQRKKKLRMIVISLEEDDSVLVNGDELEGVEGLAGPVIKHFAVGAQSFNVHRDGIAEISAGVVKLLRGAQPLPLVQKPQTRPTLEREQTRTLVESYELLKKISLFVTPLS